MSAAPVLAFGAAVSAVAAAWDLLATFDGSALVRLVAPLRRAGLEGREPSSSERRRLALLATGCLAAAGWILGGAVLGLCAALAGPAAVVAAIRARRRRYSRAVADGAADAARAIASGLAAGHTVRAALAEAGTEVAGAAGVELRGAAHALSMGEPTEAVLEGLRRRAGAPAWDTLVAALLLNRTAGGDLAGLLRELSASLEAATRARREARTATAQSRTTAWIVLALPAGAALLAELGSPGLIAGLLAQPLSAALAFTALTLQLTAAALVRRLAR